MSGVLIQAGYQPRISSLIRIEPIPAVVKGQALEKYSCFIFVSAAAVRLATGIVFYLRGIQQPAIYAVGPETERQLAQLGLKSVSSETADSEGLLALAGLHNIGAQCILIVCGRGGRKTLQENLQHRGAAVSRAEVYQRLPVYLTIENSDEIDAVIISSGEGLRFFLDLTTDIPARVPLLLPSQRVAEQAKTVGVKNFVVCDGASPEAVLSKLDTIFSGA